MLSDLNTKMQGRVFLATKRLLAAALVSLPWLSACSDSVKLPQPPLSFPFDTQKAGFKVEMDFRVSEFDVFNFDFLLAFKEKDPLDRDRVKKLAGDYAQDKDGKLVQPGVPIPIRIRLNAREPSALEGVFEKEFREERMYAYSDTYYQTEITRLRLKPGTYHIVIENLKDVPALQGTPVTLNIASRPKTNPISD